MNATIDRNKRALTLAKTYQYMRNALLYARDEGRRYRLPGCWLIGLRLNPETRQKSLWHRLAQMADNRDVHAGRYIQWCFGDGHFLLDPAIEPIQLLESKRMHSYLRSCAKLAEEKRVSLSNRMRELQSEYEHRRGKGMGSRKAWMLTLDTRERWPGGGERWPLLRYLLALRTGCTTLLTGDESIESAALLQYQADPDMYDQVFASYGYPIPAGFGERADKLFAEVIDDCARVMGVP